MDLHSRSEGINLPQLVDAVIENDNHVFCLTCGEEVTRINEDTHEPVCGSCGGGAIYEAEELFMVLL